MYLNISSQLDTIKTATSSSHHDSEYDTASDSQTSDDEVLRETDDVHDGEDDGSIELDLERQRGDGEENDEDGKKVDDDEDRSNPQYIPKKGVFYEHDDRTADEPYVLHVFIILYAQGDAYFIAVSKTIAKMKRQPRRNQKHRYRRRE